VPPNDLSYASISRYSKTTDFASKPSFAYFIIGEEISNWRWGYSDQLREGVRRPPLEEFVEGPGPRPPYYETMRSPSAEKLTVTFRELEYLFIGGYDQSVKDGKLKVVKMPDDSSLYLDTRLTEADQEYISRAFWHQRWWRAS